ncbi:PREDICTED: cysteine-rich venom protein TEL1-like isoform X2 [Poecilia mexicana]|uniref:cysteine-rich venom protein TEL1-like n=2 Tax=Poecilia TaxID=8080 RepID=UPI00044456DB|nr:PREDICTED: cysteine-rich venom protein TEL1-like [Poecilia formosa]XP_014852986.1 PREDICTED: cysteine-rich venom protein TEL1-like isoform X2 [Poecilia mexicana]
MPPWCCTYKSHICRFPTWTIPKLATTMHSFNLLCILGFAAALQVPGTLAETEGITRTTSTEQTEIVNKHNTLRRGVQPTASNMMKMSWNKEAATNAEKWAATCSMKHSPASSRVISTSGCGENLYMASFKNSWSNAIQAWYNEVANFRYGVGSINGGVVGHYTQVVWATSKNIGCAMAYCPNSTYKYFYVCHYCPPGNYNLTNPYKSGTSCGDCPSACDNKLCTKL